MKSLALVTFSLYSSCLWLIFASSLFTMCFCNQNSDKVQCIATERLALIQFKNSLVDNTNGLSSWSGEDCCSWYGVVCDNFTHHVQELRLHGSVNGYCHEVDDYDYEEPKQQMLGGIISPSLIKLEQLRYLDLSCNDFGSSPIPAFIGSLQNLRYLNISKSQFQGEIPHQLGNLSALLVLDVRENDIRSENLKWIENLKQLQYLDMGGINLTGASDWLQAINTLPSLQELHFPSCRLTQIPSEPTRVSFTSLIVLDLSYNSFYGLLPEWVFSLRKLITLDLTACFISGLDLRNQGGFEFDSMPSLRTLRVSRNAFANTSSFLNGLSNLNNLRFLDVSFCDIYDPILVKLQNLSLIVHLDLSYNHIVEEIPKSFSNLCNLTTLNLQSNNFSGDVSEVLERFCECESPKLEMIALGGNYVTGRLPEKLGRLKNLTRIDFSSNKLTGILPRSLGSLSLLKTLQLNRNQLEGSIPDSVGDLSSLVFMTLSYNKLNGSLPKSIGKLGKLSFLELHHNSLTGIVTENHFANLTALETLWVGDNKLVFNLVNNPPFNLKVLRIGSCSLGPLFPWWVQSQKNLEELDLANANISDTIPNWMWSTFSLVTFLNISHNNIMGKLGNIDFLTPSGVVDLSYNRFHGELPSNFNQPDFAFLDLSYNNLSGSLDEFLCSVIQPLQQLSVLNLANNNMSGGLPDCWMRWEYLVVLNLENNNLSGKIPSSLGNISRLASLNIRNNKLSGEIPMSLLNSESLLILELAENELTGRIPASIGRNNTSLKILSLRSNKLEGEIPNEICRLSSIQVLDLADNNLSGYLPKCFTNFTVFSGKQTSNPIVLYNTIFQNIVLARVTLMTKGQFYLYSSILYLVTTVDLSDNNFSGSIPNELLSLSSLRYLNLSQNELTGRIPNTFGEMRELESLDLSMNYLDGEIPFSLAGLSGLSLLNVSYNNLTGRIPIGSQIQTFNEFSFIGNALCGAPLPGCRPNSDATNGTNDDHDVDEPDGTDWILVICMIVGLGVGFWITIGTLIVSKQWRDAYYHFLEKMRIRLVNFILFVSM